MATSPEVIFLSDLLLPRDPQSALHAATKQYVDTGLSGKASDEHTHTLSEVTGLGTVASLNTGTASGNVPVLDSGGKISVNVLPAIAITDTFTVASEEAMLALSAQQGDVAIRTDENKCYILASEPATTEANWKELITPTDSVTSVNGQTGTVTLTLATLGAASASDLTSLSETVTSHTAATAIHVPTSGTTGHVLTKTASGAEFTAIPATTWASITGKPASFTPAEHDHDSDYVALDSIGAASGVASLGADGKVPIAQVPTAASVTASSTEVPTAAAVKTYVDGQSYSSSITGDGSTTSFEVTHSLGVQDVQVDLFLSTTVDSVTTLTPVQVLAVRTSTTKITLEFAVAPANGTVYVVKVRK